MCCAYSDFIQIESGTAKENQVLRKVTPGTMSGSPCGILSMHMVTNRKINRPESLPQRYIICSTKNYFILLRGPFYTQLFISPAPYEPVLQKLSPGGSAHFPHLSEGPTGQDNTLYWEVIGSFQGLHVFRVIGPEDPWLLPGPEHNIRSSVSSQPGDFPSPPDWSSMKTEAHLLSLLS